MSLPYRRSKWEYCNRPGIENDLQKLFYSESLYCIIFYCIVFYSISFYSILSYFILFDSTLFCSKPSTLLDCVLYDAFSVELSIVETIGFWNSVSQFLLKISKFSIFFFFWKILKLIWGFPIHFKPSWVSSPNHLPIKTGRLFPDPIGIRPFNF